ncbi:MAG: hypothetical protein LAT83_22230, partial [Kiritimatiellae bacterium]|nr:hypothetical protein [Kiritimatiellia bacterium]
SLLSALWEKRIGAITYRKSVENVWPEAEFGEVEVTHPSGERTTINVPNQFPSRSGSLILSLRKQASCLKAEASFRTPKEFGVPRLRGFNDGPSGLE